MIASKTVTEVRRLLAVGNISHRKIAELTGICRGSVGAIASGKRPDYETLRQPEDADWEAPAGPPTRCAGCGGKVYTPCQRCCVRAAIAKNPRLARQCKPVEVNGSMELDLRPEHRVRYEEVRARRRELAHDRQST